MTRPIRIYRHGGSLIPSTTFSACEIVAGEANPTNYHPGKMLQLGSAFQLYANSNNYIVLRNDTTLVSVYYQIPEGGYSASDLASAINAFSFHVNGFSANYSSTTRLWSFIALEAFTIRWTAGPVPEATALLFGFDQATDSSATGPGFTVTGINEVYVKDYHWVGWNVAAQAAASSQQVNGIPLEMIMAYATNLASADTIQAFAHTSWLGERPEDWQGAAAFQGVEFSATNDRSNDLYTWEVNAQAVGTGGQVTTIPLKYVALFIFRGDNPNQATMAPFKLGVAGVWEDADFDGADYSDRTIRSAFESRRVVLDSFTESDAGGNLEIGTRRGYREIVMGYGGWDDTAHNAFDTYLDKRRIDAALWIPDPDFVRKDSTLFGFVPPDGWSGVDWTGPTHKRAATVRVRGVRMQPEV